MCLCRWENLHLTRWCEIRVFLTKTKRREEHCSSGNLSNLLHLLEAFVSGKWSSRRNKPYLYSNLLRRNPHCQAHKRFIELGKARSYRKLVRRYCDAIKQGTDQKNPKSGSHGGPREGYRDCCVSLAVALTC